MEDEHTLKEIVCEKYPDLPYFLFGHSMGSFITRDFIAKYGDELTGATICGTTGIFRGADDPFDAFTRPTSNRSVYDFIQMMLQIEGTEWAEKVPADLPIYNIAGDQNPVGEYGVGVYQVSNWLVQTGHKVTTKLYSGYRHEIHNYAEIKNEVEAGIIAFMIRHYKKSIMKRII